MVAKIKIGVDIGGTHVRVGLVDTEAVKLIEDPPLEEFVVKGNDGVVDIRATVALAVKMIQSLIDKYKLAKVITKSLGVGAPGAYYSEGMVHPGTVPNIPELEKVKLYELFQEFLGSEWEIDASCVNNDGVVQGLVATQQYLNEYPEISEGKIIAFLPGTGFGAGGYDIWNNRATPFPGPQQFFDIVVRNVNDNEMIVGNDGNVVAGQDGDKLTIEQVATGRAIGLLGSYYLSKSLTGVEVGKIALNGMNLDEKSKAIELYEKAGREIGYLIVKIFLGMLEKTVIRHELKTKGTNIFILGGWLISEAAVKFVLPQIARPVNILMSNVRLVKTTDINGLENIIDHLGVVGAAMLSK